MTSSLLGMAQAPGGAQAGQQPNILTSMVIPFALMFAIIYFLMIRPQKKQQKKTQEMLSALKRGDQVVTRAGIFGKISEIADTTVTVEIASNVKVKMSRDAVVVVVSGTAVTE
ncbi:MAG: preprotein translocase subunit YajC [Deltaproteobacteria bacterium]|nr:preprotein translocase subunit YajC [Deltaproteobacteria bacterium]